MTYYSATAYDSLHPREVRPEQENVSFVHKSAKKYSAKGINVQSEEYLGLEFNIETVSTDSISWSVVASPILFVSKVLASLLLIFGILTFLDELFTRQGEYDWVLILSLSFIILPSIFFIVILILKKKGKLKSKGKVVLNRRTGMVTFPWKGKQVNYPFDEFTVSIKHAGGYSGELMFHPFFFHRYTGQWFSSEQSYWHVWKAELYWEIIQHYMDISKPIPDIPQLEPFRSKDPVTVEWDDKHQRPQDYWKNLPIERVDEMHEASRSAAEKFPWGLTREQAMESGWIPSGVGQGDWSKA